MRTFLGTGIRRGQLGLDVAYRYGCSSRRASQFLEVDEILSHKPASSIGMERVHEHRLDFSVIYQFDCRPVERALRHLLVGH